MNKINLMMLLSLINCTGKRNEQERRRQRLNNIAPTVDDDEGRINFSVALSPKTTRTRNNKFKH